MFPSLWLQPLQHGAVGILDEVLAVCLPLVVVIIILVRTLHRMGQPHAERKREDRSASNANRDTQDKPS